MSLTTTPRVVLRALLLCAFLVLPSSASAEVAILSRGFAPDPAIVGTQTSLTVEVSVDQAPYTVEFFRADPTIVPPVPAPVAPALTTPTPAATTPTGTTPAGTTPTTPVATTPAPAPAPAPAPTPPPPVPDLAFGPGSGETNSLTGIHTFTFDPGPRGPAERGVSVRVTDASGATVTERFAFQEPIDDPNPTELPRCSKVVTFGVVHVSTSGRACWQQFKAGAKTTRRSGVSIEPKATFYETSSGFNLNGIPFPAAPRGSKYVLVEPTRRERGGQIGLNKQVELRLGSIVVMRRNLLWSLPQGRTRRGVTSGELAPFRMPTTSLAGLPILGDVRVVLGKQGADHFAQFPVNVVLPSAIQPSPGARGRVTGIAEFSTSVRRGIKVDGAKIEVDNAAIGKLKLDNVCFSFLSARASSRFSACDPPRLSGVPRLQCAPPPFGVTRVDGSAVVGLPVRRDAQLGAFAGMAGGNFRFAGGFVDNARIPIASGITLERVGFGVCINPLVLRADAGLAIAGGALRGDVSVAYVEQGRGFFIDTNGAMRAFGLPLGRAHVRLFNTGAIDFDASTNFSFARGLVTLDGSVAGGMRPSPFRFNVEGRVQLCLKIAGCATAQGIVSNKGVSGCVTVRPVLFKISFSGFFSFQTRKLDAGLGCKRGKRARVRLAKRFQAGGAVTFPVPEDGAEYVAHIKGVGAPPKLKITSPSGRVITSTPDGVSTDQRSYLLFENPDTNETSIFLDDSAAEGSWTAEALPGSALTGEVDFQEKEKAPTVATATIKPAKGGKKALDLVYSLRQGDTMTLEVVGEGAQQTLREKVVGKRCTGGKHAPGRSVNASRCLRFTFTPNFGYKGKRTVQLIVNDSDGAPVETIKVATYRATDPPMPTTAPNVRIIRKGSSVFVVWGKSKRGLKQYGLSAKLSDGRQLGFTAPASCLAWKIPNVSRTTKVAAKVYSMRQDLEHGRVASRTLAGKRTYAGPKRLKRAKVPRTCKGL